MAERGTTEEEVRATVEHDEPFPAKFGRMGFRRNFRCDHNWHGRHYHTKQIAASGIQEGTTWLVITMITRSF